MTDDDLPPLPEPHLPGEYGRPEPLYTAEQMRAYARAVVEQFLVRSGQYLTNDASREAAIRDAVEAEREACAKVADFEYAACWHAAAMAAAKAALRIAEAIRARGEKR